MESGDISGPNDGAGPSFSQSVEVLPPPPPNPPQMATQSVPSSSEPAEDLAPPPPLPPQMAQKLPEAPRVVLLKRPGQGRAGKPVKLLCNHFRVNFTNLQDSFHYDDKSAGANIVGGLKEALRKVLVLYHFMAGRLKLNLEKGRLEIDCNRAGALFAATNCDLNLSDLGDVTYPNPVFRSLVLQGFHVTV